MATQTVFVKVYLDLPECSGEAEEIVKDALSTDDRVYLVKVDRAGVLLER